MRREFHLQDDTSNKFWTIELAGSTCVTTHGRVGAKPRETRTEFPSAAEAQRDLDRRIAAKLGKGYVEGALATIPARGKTDWSSSTMSEDVFWRIIRLLQLKKVGDDDAVLERAVAALAQMTEQDIFRFEDILASKLHGLDTEQHARATGADVDDPDRHFSVDQFLYARCFVVAAGRDAYEYVLGHPEEMSDDVDLEFEAILSLAGSAFERKTGNEFEYTPAVSYETFANVAGWPRSSRQPRIR